LLKTADQSVKEATQLDDYTVQIMALTTLALENNRMVTDLSNLPLPRGLKAQEQAQYMALMKRQSMPFAQKSEIASQKLGEFWKNEKVLTRITEEYTKSKPELRPLLRTEISILMTLAPSASIRSYLRSAIESSISISMPSAREIMSARETVRANPESASDIEKLKNLETKSGHSLMVSYLEGRLEQIRMARNL
jgi:hypothetical protein